MRRFLRALVLFALALLCIVAVIGQPAPTPAQVQAQAGLQTTTLPVTDGYDTKLRKRLSEDGKVYTVQFDDDDRWETEADHFTSFQFGHALPADASIQSVKVIVEHHEEDDFQNGALRWEAGIGDLRNPIPLTSRAPKILRGEKAEGREEWDVTTLFGTPALLNNLKFVVRNNDGKGKKTKTDYLFVVVTYRSGATPTPTRTSPPPTATATASATPTNPPGATPTRTSTPPGATPEASVTATDSPSATPTPTPPPTSPPGSFPPIEVYAPMIAYEASLSLDNHTACTAYVITPPTTVVQAADNGFNIYRFVAAAPAYTVALRNYATSGQLLLYRITADTCATTGTLSLSFVKAMPVASPSFQTTFDALTPGERYMLAVNTTGPLTNQPYAIAIRR